MANFCPECGNRVSGGKFCSDCGNPLEAVSSDKIHMPVVCENEEKGTLQKVRDGMSQIKEISDIVQGTLNPLVSTIGSLSQSINRHGKQLHEINSNLEGISHQIGQQAQRNGGALSEDDWNQHERAWHEQQRRRE